MEQQKTNFDELAKDLSDAIMIVEVEKMLKEVPLDEDMSDEELRESLICPERSMARYLVKNGIIKKIQLNLLEKIKSLSTTIEIKELYFAWTIGDVISKEKIDMLIEKIGANNGKEN